MGKKSSHAVRSAPRHPGQARAGRRSRSSVPREPCPCGSGRRYKACHGRAAVRRDRALRPAPVRGPGRRVRLGGDARDRARRHRAADAAPASTPDREATLATVLPMAWPGLVRQDGAVFAGLQVNGGSRATPAATWPTRCELALDAEPGTPDLAGDPARARAPACRTCSTRRHRCRCRCTAASTSGSTASTTESPDVVASMERANEAVVPTVRLSSVEAAYWCEIRDRQHLRWVLPHDEEAFLDAIARLHATGADGLGEGSRYVGSFRAHGLVVPVWDLAEGTGAEAVEEPVAALAGRLAEALAETRPARPGGTAGAGRPAQPADHAALTRPGRRSAFGSDLGRSAAFDLHRTTISDIVELRPERCCIPRRLRSGRSMSAAVIGVDDGFRRRCRGDSP